MSDIIWTPVKIRLGQVKPWDKNPRMSTKAQAERLIRSERDLGQIQTLAVGPFDADGFCDLYDGHQRQKAWFTVKGASFELWAIQSNRPLREEERRQAAILVHTATGSFDWQALSAWPVAELKEWSLATMENVKGWQDDITNVKEILKSEQAGGADADVSTDRAAELLEKWGVTTGSLWQIGDHRLICGDCTDAATVARVMDGEKAGACVTDVPYGQNQVDVTGDEPEDNAELLRNCVAQMPIDNGIVITFESPRTFPKWMEAISNHKFLRALWLYKEAQMANPWRGWILKSEMILISEIGKGEWLDVHPFAHDCYKLSEVSYRTEKIAPVRPHGSVKPLVVVQDLVSRVGGDVYEPFCGSGTTMVACENLRRKCRAIEISPAYCSVALERMSQAFPSLEIRRL